MRTRRLRLLGASQSSTTNAVVTSTIVRPGIITGVTWNNQALGMADGTLVRVELSFQNTNQATATEVTNIISEHTLAWQETTSGMAFTPNIVDLGMAVPVQAGDKIYINLYISGTAAVTTSCIVSISE